MLTQSRLYAKEFIFDKRSYIKQTIYQILRNSNGNTCMLFFISHLDCCFRRSQFKNTLLHQSEGVGNSHKNINILPFYSSSVTPPPPSVKTTKNLRSIRKLKHARYLYFPRGDAQTVSTLFITSELVKTLYSVMLLSSLLWKQ